MYNNSYINNQIFGDEDDYKFSDRDYQEFINVLDNNHSSEKKYNKQDQTIEKSNEVIDGNDYFLLSNNYVYRKYYYYDLLYGDKVSQGDGNLMFVGRNYRYRSLLTQKLSSPEKCTKQLLYILQSLYSMKKQKVGEELINKLYHWKISRQGFSKVEIKEQ